MKILLSTLALALLATPVVASAQTANPVSDALRQTVQHAAKNMVAAAQEMPANKYSYRPTAKQMSFGQLVLHVTGANAFMCSSISGKARPQMAKLTPQSPKDQLVAALKASFQYCTDSLQGVTDAQLNDKVPFFGGRQVTRGAMILSAAGDWADHYGQAATMLRLNGMLPPTARH